MATIAPSPAEAQRSLGLPPVVDGMPIRTLREFTADDLRRYNGLDGSPSFIGFQGKVYDVSKSFLWKEGRHEATHQAGTDLTQALVGAPHGVELLEKYPVVGVLVEKTGRGPISGKRAGA
ncbi:MAG: hypothetical protein A2Z66_02230, partial [Chloroflexi bacterium RBG_13_66_10]